ncbi:MAG: hypothetical protein KF690_05615 [Bacteroidetes bacterium]|nr:hypothetical protein [Bacteroidota bacterium]
MNVKKLQLLGVLMLLGAPALFAQNNFGIGVPNPVEKLDVAGAVKLGNTGSTAATSLGAIRYTGADFEGLMMVAGVPTWVSLTAGGTAYTAGTGLTLTAGQFSVNNLAGDVTGAPNATVVERLQGRAMANTAPANGQVLTWNNALSRWEPTAVPAPTSGNLTLTNPATIATVTNGTGAVLGTGTSITINNTAAFWNANQLQGRAVVNTAPTNGQVLKWNNALSQWEPAADAGTNYSAGTGLTLTGTTFSVDNLAGDVTGAPGSTVVSRIQTTPVSATAPTLGQILIFNGASWTPTAIPTPNDLTAGAGIAFTTGTTYNGTTARTITAPVMTGASAGAPGTSGIVPVPAAGQQNNFLRGDGTWAAAPTAAAMVGATGAANGTAGIVPQPLAGQQNNFLRGDGTWAAAPTAAAMVGATGAANGTAGIVPQPLAGQQNNFLRGDGTWAASTVNAQNGLNTTASGTGAVELGGTLLRATDVAQAGFNLTFTGNGNVGIGQAAPTHRLHVTAPAVDATRAIFASHPNNVANVVAIEASITSPTGVAGNNAAAVLGRTSGGGSGVRGEGLVVGMTGVGTRTQVAGGSVGVSGTGATYGLQANGTTATTGIGVFALGNNLTTFTPSLTTGGGVVAEGTLNGVVGAGSASGGFGIYGLGVNVASSFGVVGQANNTALVGPAEGAGVLGLGTLRGGFFQGSTVANGIGIIGLGNNLTSFPISATGAGVIGRGNTAGIRGYGALSVALGGSAGVSGEGSTYGVQGVGTNATSGIGLLGFGNNATAILGSFPTDGCGVVGSGVNGVWGVALTDAGYGVAGINDQPSGFVFIPVGVYGQAVDPLISVGVLGEAPIGGLFTFGTYAQGDVGASGTKPFVIDHPQDPANKILRHFALESDEVLNVYRGTITLDASGEAVVTLKNYVTANNINFTYQLTAIGQQANAYIKEELQGDRFVIAGGNPGQKISWVVYAERNDPYLQQYPHKRQVEIDKPASMRGKYFTPELYGQPASKSLFSNKHKQKTELKPLGGPTTMQEIQPMRTGQKMEDVKPIGR